MPSQSGTDARPAEPADPAESDPAKPADPVLAAEREHLRESREYLRLMREDVLALPALGGDRVSIEYLKADLHHRAEALRDIPDAPLFFGRLDYAPGSVWSEEGEAGEDGARFHIGRRHVHDPDGHPIVIDWRAPVSRAVLPGQPVRSDGPGAAAQVRVLRREPDRLRRRGVRRRGARPGARRQQPAGSCWRRSNGRGRAPCATSWRRSSPTRTTSSAPTPTRPCACRARRAPARPRSACTGSPTCSTRTRTG